MSVSVCLYLFCLSSVRKHISGTTCLIFSFCPCYPWPWLGSPVAAVRFVEICTVDVESVVIIS